MQATTTKTKQPAANETPASRPAPPPLTVIPSAAPAPERALRRFYLRVPAKYLLSFVIAWAWMGVSLWLAMPWADTLSAQVTTPLAWLIIFGIAITPGFMNAFMVMSLALDQRPERKPLAAYPGITVLVAAYNEAASIADTLKSLHAQHYAGLLQVIVINDGSSDNTAAIVRGLAPRYPWLELIDLTVNGGKANALNHGLQQARHRLIVTVDADSWLFRNALNHLVERYMQDPVNTRAVAGAVMVRNSRTNWITRMQEWDYFQGIASVKRVQSLYHGTMVAQGAFSIYDRQTIEDLGGFPDCIGEDIVLTWGILARGWRVGHCESALVFTNVPTTLRQFLNQRKRWARGLIEAFKQHPSLLLRPRLSTTFIYWNLMFPLLDLAFSLCFLPGLIACFFGYFWVVGPMTLSLIPLAVLFNYVNRRTGTKMYTAAGLKVRTNRGGFLFYSLFYSLLMQPVSLWGYASELLNLRKTWGTK